MSTLMTEVQFHHAPSNAPGSNAPGSNAPPSNAPGANAAGINAAGINAPAPRHDFYAGIHKGLRAWMCDVLVQAGRVDPADQQELDALGADVRALMRACRSHLSHEEQFVHPAMERQIPGTTQRVAAEHVEHEAAITRIETELRGLEQAEPAVRPIAAERLYRRLALFIADNFQHMEVEQTEHNAVLWATYTDAALEEIEQTIIASLGPEEMAESMRWVVPAMAAPERAAMFSSIRANAPAEAFDALLGMARPFLSGRDWSKLCAAVAPVNR